MNSIRIFLVTIIVGISILGTVVRVVATQIENIPIVRGVWSPENDLIALMNFRPSQNTVEILTSALDQVATLYVDELPDRITQVDAQQIAWSPSGDKLAAVFYATDNIIQDYTYVIVWNAETWTETFRLTNQGTMISWSPSGEYVTTGWQVFDVISGELVGETGRNGDFNYVAWHPTEENQLLLGYDEEIVIINPWTGESLYTYSYSPYIEPKFSPNGQYLAIDKNNLQVIEILDTSNYQPITTIDYSDYNIGRIDWLGNELISSLTLDDNAIIWDRSTGFVVDSVGFDITIWNEDGSQFIARGDQVDAHQPSIAVFDRITEAVITQVSSPVAIRSAAVTHTITADILQQLLGSAVINDLELTTVVDGVLQAFTYPDEIGSVTFTVNGVTTVDNTVPYTFSLPGPGMHTVTISSYTAQDAQGDEGLSFTVVFAIN